jgi:hypothetical protein
MRHTGWTRAAGMLVVLGLAGCAQRAATPAPAAESTHEIEVVQVGIPGVLADVVPSFSLFPIVASRSQRIAHRTSCRLVAALPEKDRQYFRGYSLAVKEGFTPCAECRPDRE